MNPVQSEIFPDLPTTKPVKYKAGGMPAPQGSGPKGEKCATCGNLYRNNLRSGRTFYKCLVIKHEWTGSYGTDVRLKYMACGYWKPGKESPHD